ncbi:hypothetical protein [Novosphingobium beihaiensis]|uniref:Uncharacterized protein n=1 Tax=Novosphingobium beihaiensis TaxID=2930389 RepID=A0ABT0BRZ7_9SPHN|nr:hypothetical protein [Novosphingobium beihaiensis]MCJ2187653.1 hypothetical protein [Novosphingobium beihaiensis]
MHVTRNLDCSGLSNASAVLRIKQALVGSKDGEPRIGVLVGENCDVERITGSLGSAAGRVRLMSATRQ